MVIDDRKMLMSLMRLKEREVFHRVKETELLPGVRERGTVEYAQKKEQG